MAAAADTQRRLVTAADVARKLGVSRQRGHELTLRDDFPTPVAWLTNDRRLWSESDVDRWVKERTTR